MALKEESNTLTVERDRAVRVIGTGMGLFLLLAPLGLRLTAPPGRFDGPEATGFLLVLMVFCLPLALLLFWLGGPYRLTLDFTSRTYRWVSGLPLIARERSGSFADFREVYVSMAPTKGGPRYQVTLGWSAPGPGAGLAVLWDEGEALREAERIAARIGVPFSREIRGKVTRFRVGNVRTPLGMAVSVVLWLVMSSFFLAMGLPGLLRESALDARGRETPGKITSVRISTGRGSSNSLAYAYRVGGTWYEEKCAVTQADAERSQVGQNVTVRYLPDAPQVSRLPNSIARRSLWVQVGFGVLMLVLAPVDWVSNERQRQRQGVTF